MRMKKRGLNDPGRPFQAPEATKHSGHIGPAPKAGPKRAVNVSVDTEILAVAKDLGLNLSQTLEDALRALTREERLRRFHEENKESIDSFNALIERAGVFGEELLDLDDLDDPAV
jgi:antitoxin CcdA